MYSTLITIVAGIGIIYLVNYKESQNNIKRANYLHRFETLGDLRSEAKYISDEKVCTFRNEIILEAQIDTNTIESFNGKDLFKVDDTIGTSKKLKKSNIMFLIDKKGSKYFKFIKK